MSNSHFADIAAAIRQRLAANWATTPILYENLDENQVQTAGQNPESFIVLEIIPLMNEQKDFGDPAHVGYRTRGIFNIHILTPANAGDGLALEYADTLAAIFRGKEFSGVICYGSTIRGGGQKADAAGRYWQVVLSTEFYCDKTFDL
jgi:hypothetical protein